MGHITDTLLISTLPKLKVSWSTSLILTSSLLYRKVEGIFKQIIDTHLI
jgi:hypothetical protein